MLVGQINVNERGEPSARTRILVEAHGGMEISLPRVNQPRADGATAGSQS